MTGWSMEEKIRWGFAAATLALLLVLGATYVLLQDSSRSAHRADDTLEVAAPAGAQDGLERDLKRTRTLFGVLAIAIMVLGVLLATLLRQVLVELRSRRSDEARLREANHVLETLLESIPAMVFAKDATDLRFVRFNRAGERLLGYPRDALLGKNDRDFFPDGQAEAFIRKDREVLAQTDMVDIPAEEIDTRDRGRRILHTRKVPVRDENGRPVLLLGISMDITEQKAAEQHIHALNEEAIRRTQMLEASNRELESFCYSVSHDLRTPLRAINGFAQLLQQDFRARLEGDGLRYLNTISAASERMGHLIDDLLEFSRLGRQTLELEAVDMEALARKALGDSMLARAAPLPTVSIAALPPVQGDRRMLHLVWMNLLDNAVKYSVGGSAPHVDIWAETSATEIAYHIRDNGIGFDMSYYGKLFGVFQRLHSNPAYPGTGVGLAIAHRVVTRHNGRIWATGELGKGATFSFALPTSTATGNVANS
jgi:PAS domain S-box-containing protein